MNRVIIGKRLALLREELSGAGGEKWTQTMVADETGLTKNMIGQMERSGAGGIEIFVTYLLFFHQRGYNINWIILPDNSRVTKMQLGAQIKAVELQAVVNQFENIKQVIVRELDNALKSLG